jgi:hypothetical protein
MTIHQRPFENGDLRCFHLVIRTKFTDTTGKDERRVLKKCRCYIYLNNGVAQLQLIVTIMKDFYPDCADP